MPTRLSHRAKVAPLTGAAFAAALAALPVDFACEQDVMVAVSGGADSLALLCLLSDWAARCPSPPRLHAVTIDHRLRPESKAEARQVAAWVKDWPHVTHSILPWTGRKPKTRVSEAARAARYALIQDYAVRNKIRFVCLAHHQDDQAETFLLRLAAGSGLDGLSGMLSAQPLGEIVLLRPLLNVSHAVLVSTLRKRNQGWIEDPTNANTEYARPRLRAAVPVLEREGLTASRLATTAERIAQGRLALEYVVNNLMADYVEYRDQGACVPGDVWAGWPFDLRVRVLSRMLNAVNGQFPPARLEQIERAVIVLSNKDGPSGGRVFRFTLGGCVLTRGRKTLKVIPERSVK